MIKVLIPTIFTENKHISSPPSCSFEALGTLSDINKIISKLLPHSPLPHTVLSPNFMRVLGPLFFFLPLIQIFLVTSTQPKSQEL